MDAPTIETLRLVLRAHMLADFPNYAGMRADPEVMSHMGDGSAISEEQAWSGFLRAPGSWHFLGFGPWAIIEKESGRYVGDVAFNDRKRDRGDDLAGLPEMGWALARVAFGKGYATEAVGAALEWGRTNLGSIRVIALTSEDNFASMRVAEKCGFREFKRALSDGRPRVYFDRTL